MAFVDDHQRARRKVVDQRGRRLAGAASGQVPRVVLDALAESDFRHHLQVEAGALLDPLRLDQLHLPDEEVLLLDEFDLDLLDRVEDLLPPGHVVAGRKHREPADLLPDVPGQRIEELQRLDLVVEQRDAHRVLGVLGRKDVEHVAADPESAALEVELRALVLHLGQAPDGVALRDPVAHRDVQDHAVVLGGVADAVDRRHRGDDHAIGALEDRLGRRQPHLLDVLVDRAVLLDVEVARGNVGLRLVVIVVGDEVLDGVVREELAELAVELRGERLVGCEHQRRPAGAGDDVGHRVGLAGARDAEQRLEREAVLEALDQLGDRLRLVAGGREGLVELERAARERDDHVASAWRAGGTAHSSAERSFDNSPSRRCGDQPPRMARSSLAELQRRQPRIQRTLRDQRLVGPGGDHPSAVEHGDTVDVTHRRQPVRDDQRRPAGHQVPECLLHGALALGIERRGRLVEEQDRAGREDRAGDSQPLPLATGQADAPLAQEARVALRQPRDELVGARGHAGRADFVVGRVGATVADVFQHRRGEDHRVLRNDRDPAPHVRGLGGPHVDAVDEHPRPPADRRTATTAGRPSSCRHPTARPGRHSRRSPPPATGPRGPAHRAATDSGT